MGKSSGGSKVESRSTLSPSQQKLLDAAAGFIQPKIGEGGTETPFDIVADQPELFMQAFNEFQTAFNDTEQADRLINQLEGIATGTGTFKADLEGVSSAFQQNVFNPAVQAITETVGKSKFDEINQPGRFFASDSRARVSEAVSNVATQTLSPLLAQSLEAERGREFASIATALARQPQAISALQQAPAVRLQQAFGAAGTIQNLEQQRLNLLRQEFLRTSAPESDPFLQLALGLATKPTVQSLAVPQGEKGGLGAAIGGAAGLGLAALTGGAGGSLLGATGLGMGVADFAGLTSAIGGGF